MLLNPSKNYAPLAASFLIALGWLNVLGLNLIGILLIWLGSSIKKRDPVARKIALWLLGLYIILLLGVLIKAALWGTSGLAMTFYAAVSNPPIWLLMVVSVIMLALVGIPFALLASTGTKRAYEHFALIRATVPCENCQYNLRGVTTGICPGCDAPFDRDRLKECESAAPVCQNCWYCLRGLSEPRCPECGTPFDLGQLQAYDKCDHESN